MFSERTRISREPNRFARVRTALEAEGERLLDLTVSNPTRLGFGYAKQAIADALGARETFVYEPEAFGSVRARADLVRELGVSLPIAQVVLTASTSEAYSFCFKLLCDPGSSVLVPEPSYPLLDHLARLEHARRVPYRLLYDGAWHIDFESLTRAIDDSTRAIVVVNPNNPTGSYLSKVELEKLASFGLPLVSDEVFASFPLTEDPRRAETALAAEGVLVFVLGGLSKLAGLPQMKLGWMLVEGPPEVRDEALGRLEIIADSFLSVGAPVQAALPTLLRHAESTRLEMLQRLRQNLVTSQTILDGSAAHVLRVEGGFYAVIRLPKTRSDDEWATTLLERDKVLTQPGWLFDFSEGAHLVISLLSLPDELREGLERLRRLVEES